MVDDVPGEDLDLAGYVTLDLEHDFLWERLAEVALARDEHLSGVAVKRCVLESSQWRALGGAQHEIHTVSACQLESL